MAQIQGQVCPEYISSLSVFLSLYLPVGPIYIVGIYTQYWETYDPVINKQGQDMCCTSKRG